MQDVIVIGIAGGTGSGKSTISKIITGVYGKDSGTIVYEGREIAYKNPNDAKMDGISMVFQNLSLIPDLTVWQNIVLGIEKKKGLFLNDRQAMELARGIIEDLKPGMDVTRRVGELNPGEQQITEIAKAISVRPKLLIFDEPTAALEQEEVKSLFRYMRKLADEGVAMIFTSHRLGEVMEICDDIVVFRNGENVGSMDFAKDGRDPEAIVRMITGETEGIEVTKEYRDIPDETVFSVENLNYGKFLRDVGFRLRRGEVLGIGGLAGQGQTELMLAQRHGGREGGGAQQAVERGAKRRAACAGRPAKGRLFPAWFDLLQHDLSQARPKKAAAFHTKKEIPRRSRGDLQSAVGTGPRYRCGYVHPVGRQPAKGSRRQVAAVRYQGAAFGRPGQGRRCARQKGFV